MWNCEVLYPLRVDTIWARSVGVLQFLWYHIVMGVGKWSNGVGKGEMFMFWCTSITCEIIQQNKNSSKAQLHWFHYVTFVNVLCVNGLVWPLWQMPCDDCFSNFSNNMTFPGWYQPLKHMLRDKFLSEFFQVTWRNQWSWTFELFSFCCMISHVFHCKPR